MLNLLDSDEEDFVPEDNKPYNQETEIEPLVWLLNTNL